MFSKLFRVLLLLPVTYWIYLIFWGDLGADPAKNLNHLTGPMALYYIILNLAIGILISFSFKFPKFLRFLLTNRRFLGVLSFIFLIFHVTLYFLMEGFEKIAFVQLVTKTYLILGLLAWLILLVLAVTSNDYSVRKLGGKRWKLLHRSVYLASAFLTVHILLIEKADLLKYGIILSSLWVLQFFRVIRNRKNIKVGL
ncbi:MAG: ferric reductase-like transmembrane domain-containing protein [Bdellovibrio sp.]|nr:ferric reductase-like transmembrane domain-containing protein [Bdellovibrio sp.]